MRKLNLQKIKEISTIIAAICGAIAGLWGAFKPEKKAESGYAATIQKVNSLEDEITHLYNVAGDQQKQITFLLNILNSNGIYIKDGDTKVTENTSKLVPLAIPSNNPSAPRLVPFVRKPMPNFHEL
jgi:hypothetical protein